MTGERSEGSFINSPRQLIAVVVLGFVVPVLAAALLAYFVVGESKIDKDQASLNAEAVAKRIKPIGDVTIAEGGGGVNGEPARTGEQIVQAACSKCHESGAHGAPRIGDRAAWSQRISRGLQAVTKSAIRGHGKMPARGGLADVTDEELSQAIIYMFTRAGADVAPVAPQATVAAAAAPKAEAGGKGKSIFDTTCSVCHATGVAGAPKAGDKAAWAPRIKTGINALYATALKGKGAMPARGGNTALSDADVKAAVDYLVSLAK